MKLRFRFSPSLRCLMVLFLAFMLVLPSVAPAAAAFKDLPNDNAGFPYVKYVTDKKWMSTFPDGSFRPNAPVTRADLATAVTKSFALPGYAPRVATFKDVRKGTPLFAPVEAAVKAGLMKGFADKTFRPSAPVTRGEVASVLLRATKKPVPVMAVPSFVTDVKPGHPYAAYVVAALDSGMMPLAASGCFAPDKAATRVELARALAVVNSLIPEKKLALTCLVVPTKGMVTITLPGRPARDIKTPITCGKGTQLATGSNSTAELRFPDGSGVLLKEKTTVVLKDAVAQTAVQRNGSTCLVLDRLALELKSGRIFGGIAPGYVCRNYACEDSSGGWWRQTTARKVRVTVDMPWGVAGIRGTFWANDVEMNLASVIDGDVVLTANGKTTAVTRGQAASMEGKGSPPVVSEKMPKIEQQSWQEVKLWVKERTDSMQQNASIVVPPTQQQMEQPGMVLPAIPDITNYVWGNFGLSTEQAGPLGPVDGGYGAAGG